MRAFVIGDIHGAYKALKQCLERSGFDYEEDLLITLGDICDGHNEVKECVDELLKIQHRIDVIGNHDKWFLDWLKGAGHRDSWGQGGLGTLESYERAAQREIMIISRDTMFFDENGRPKWITLYETDLQYTDIPSSHREFFGGQRLFYHDVVRNFFFVHAGFDRLVSVTDQRKSDQTDFYWNRKFWLRALSCSPGQKLQTKDDFNKIFIGHTATTYWTVDEKIGKGGIIIPGKKPITTPMYSGGVWNVDTGAGGAGKLTIMDIDTEQYWQSEFVKTLYTE